MKTEVIYNEKKYFFVLTITISCLFLSTVLFKNTTFSIVLLFLLYSLVFVNCIIFFQKKLTLSFFLITFFIFTMGQYLFDQIEPGIYYTMFSNSILCKTILLQGISLYCLYLGSLVKLPQTKKFYHLNKKTISIIKILFFASFIIAIISKLEIGYRVLKYGYMTIYTNESPSVIPYCIHYIAQFFPLIFYFYISVESSNNNFKSILLFYFIYLVATLLTGIRGEFSIGLLIIIYLYIKKNNIKIASLDYIKSNFKYILPLFLSIIACFALLNYYNSFRVNHEIEEINIVNEVKGFFINQSTSVNVISYSLEFESDIKDGKTLYTLGPVIENLNSKLAKINSDIDLSKYKTSLAKEISIIALGESAYLSGQGVGSQYIAEVFVDYGYLGVIVFNVIISIFLILINQSIYKNPIVSGTALLIFASLIYIPRGQALQFINVVLSFNFVITIISIILVDCIFKNKSILWKKGVKIC